MSSPRIVLVDAGPLFATIDPSDQYHIQARRDLAGIAERGWRLVAILPTVLEAHRLILYSLGARRAQAWLIEARSSLTTVAPSMEDYQRAVAVSLRFRDQDFTLFDTLLYVVSDQLQVPIWTYDHHFDVLRARVWRA